MRYVHTNLIARDWRRLAAFYHEVFGCIPASERDLAGEWLEHATGVPGARVRGVHLRLPGYASDGPTLEIFQYEPAGPSDLSVPNRAGFGHIAFQVDDLPAVRQKVLAAGGSAVGSIETTVLAGGRSITWTYVRDPEGNIVELQSVMEEGRRSEAR